MSTPQEPGDPQYPHYTPPPIPPVPPMPQPAPQPPAYQPPPYLPYPPSEPATPTPYAPPEGRLGPRAQVRPLPRFDVALAGAGVALAIIGVLIWGGDYLAGGFRDSVTQLGDVDSRRLPGAGLAIVVTIAGYLLVAFGRGALAAAGVAASALGVPVALSFLTIEPSRLSFSYDTVAVVSMVIWLASYLIFPRTRGHVFYLALTTWVLWLYVVDKVALSNLRLPDFQATVGGDIIVQGPRIDLTLIGGVSLAFGLVYYVITFLLDASGYAGAATGFVVSAFAATAGGIATLAPDFDQAGTGIVLVLLGAVLAWVAGRSGRRFTTWIWCAAIIVGLGFIVTDVTGDDHLAVAGGVLIVLGIVVVAVAYLAGRASSDADEVTSAR